MAPAKAVKNCIPRMGTISHFTLSVKFNKLNTPEPAKNMNKDFAVAARRVLKNLEKRKNLKKKTTKKRFPTTITGTSGYIIGGR
jgi:hypothetical protein